MTMSAIQYAPSAPAVHLSEPVNATRFSWFRFPADWNDDAHPSPQRQLFIVLAGEVEGWTSGGDKRVFRAGDCLLMEDTTGKGHGARPINGEASAICPGPLTQGHYWSSFGVPDCGEEALFGRGRSAPFA